MLPGVCSLLFMIGMASDLARGDPIVQAIAGVWIICFFISAGGAALIYVARKDARAAAGTPGAKEVRRHERPGCSAAVRRRSRRLPVAVLGMTGIVLLFPGICSLLCMISFLPGDRSAHGWGLGDHLPHRGRRNRA